MRNMRVFLTAALLICLLAACGDTSGAPDAAESSQSAPESSQSAEESTQAAILYAVFNAEGIKEYPIEYTGTQITPEGLADELSERTGLDFFVTASEAEDGLIVDWAADSTLIAGLDDREQKEEFHFFDADSLRWFMMDSLWRTLTENLDAENIYYTMDGGQELDFQKLSVEELHPVSLFPSDIPYMGSGFYYAHDDVRGDEEDLYGRTMGLWRLDGETDTAFLEMDGEGRFVTYYADGSEEALGELECTDENGELRYDLHPYEGEQLFSFYFDSDFQFHTEDGTVYILDRRADYMGFWQYPEELDGMILEIRVNGAEWYLYEDGETTPFSWGPVEYDAEACYLMNEDGSSGGGKVSFDEDGNLIDSGYVLISGRVFPDGGSYRCGHCPDCDGIRCA